MRTVLCAEGPVEPQAAIERFLELHPPTPQDPVHLVFGMRRSPPTLPFATAADGFTVGSFLPGRGLRNIEQLTYHRMSYNQICRSLADGSFRPDVLIACATSPDEHGHRSLGGVNGYFDSVLRTDPAVFVEEVPWLPHITGATTLTRTDGVVPSRVTDKDTQPHFSASFDEVDEAVAREVVRLLPANPRLALGIGRVNDAVARQLAGRGDVDVLTGVVTDAVRWMYNSGALGSRTMRAMSVIGSPALLRWASSCGDVELLPSTQIHEPSWLSAHDRFVAILGAIDLDRCGNINSERAGGIAVSGKGGAPDFARGAHDSAGGLSIVALRSSDKHHRSKLIGHREDPSINGSLIDAVVTEKGSALIAGLDAEQRAHALADIF